MKKRRLERSASRPLRLATVVGARPQFIKAAVISRAAVRLNASAPSPLVEDILIHTGQHYDDDMSRVFFRQLGLPAPRRNLEVGSGTSGRQTARILLRLEPVLRDLQPDVVLVHGDTNSTLAGALAAAQLGLPVAHGEAGLRSFNPSMPEETNRVLTDRLAAWLFCPTETAVRNLKREGLGSRARLVGDLMYDAFLANRKTALRESGILAALDVRPRRFALATIHRRENTDDPEKLRSIFSALAGIAESRFPVVVPLHPRTRKALAALRPLLAASPGLILTAPLSYFDSLALGAKARVILTDSGGLQKEAAFAGVPCVTLRRETEWVETVESGRNVIAGSDPARIRRAFDSAVAAAPAGALRLYGRGDAGTKILRILIREGRVK